MSSLEQIIAEADGLSVWPEALPPHLSASQLGMLARCPEQYRRRYLLGLMERPAGALVWGAADHYAHEVNFRQKIDTHEDLPVDDVKLACAEGFDQAVERNGGASEVDWGADKPGELKDAAVLLVEAYHRQVSPSVQPTDVEARFELRIPGVPVPVVGYVDVVTEQAAIERKTAKTKTTSIKPQWRLQGLMYQLVQRAPVDWHVSVKTKTPTVYTPAADPGLRLEPGTPELVRRLVRVRVEQLQDLYARYGKDEPWPDALTDAWACLYCGFKPNCPWWN